MGCSLGESLSGRPVNSITKLLQDDLEYCFKDSNFIFRIIAADPGSGKTALLNYLNELCGSYNISIKSQVISVSFSLNSLLSTPNSQGFCVDFYLRLITDLLIQVYTYNDVHSEALLKTCLSSFIGQGAYSEVTKDDRFQKGKLREYLINLGEDLSDLFLKITQFFAQKKSEYFF